MAAAPPRPMSTVSTQAAVKSNTTSSPASLARHLFLIIPVPLSGPYCYVLCHEFSRVSTPTFHGLLPVITIEQERARGALGFPGGADLAAVPEDLGGGVCPVSGRFTSTPREAGPSPPNRSTRARQMPWTLLAFCRKKPVGWKAASRSARGAPAH